MLIWLVPLHELAVLIVHFFWRLTIGPEGVELKSVPVLHGLNGVVLSNPAVISTNSVLLNLELSPAP